MILTKSVLATLLLLTVALGCASTSKIYLNENYQKNGSATPFSVLPLNQNWTPDASLKQMYTQELDYFFQALSPSFSRNTPNRVNIIKSDLNLTEADFKKRKLGSDEANSVEVNVPSEELTRSVEDRFIYFLEGYKFQLVQKAGDRVSYAYQQPENKLALQFETEFFLYDKSKSEVIAWGKVKNETEVYGRPKFEDYLAVLTKISKMMINESPFQLYKN